MKKFLLFFTFGIVFFFTFHSCCSENKCESVQFEKDMLLQIRVIDEINAENILPTYQNTTVKLLQLALQPIPTDSMVVLEEWLNMRDTVAFHEWNNLTDTTSVLAYAFDSNSICGGTTIYKLLLQFEDGYEVPFDVDFDSVEEDSRCCSNCDIDFIEGITMVGASHFYEYGGTQDRILTIER